MVTTSFGAAAAEYQTHLAPGVGKGTEAQMEGLAISTALWVRKPLIEAIAVVPDSATMTVPWA